jgi:hypothetical protein
MPRFVNGTRYILDHDRPERGSRAGLLESSPVRRTTREVTDGLLRVSNVEDQLVVVLGHSLGGLSTNFAVGASADRLRDSSKPGIGELSFVEDAFGRTNSNRPEGFSIHRHSLTVRSRRVTRIDTNLIVGDRGASSVKADFTVR